MIRKFGVRDAMTNAREAATLTRRVSAGSPGSGTSASQLTVSEEDASPLVENVIELEFPNDKVTDLGSGKVHIDVSGDGLSYVTEETGTPITGVIGIEVSDGTLTDLGSGVVHIDLRRVLSVAEPGDAPRVFPVTEIRVPDGTLTDLGDGNVELAVVVSSRTVTAGAGLTGGGALTANITIDVAAADTSMTINADSIQVRLATNSGMQVSSGLQLGTPTTVTSTSTNAVTTTTHSHAIDSTIVTSARTVTAGAGLTGGGALSGDITLDVVSGNTGIVVNANDITLTLNATSGLEISTGLRIADSIAGAGLTISSKVLAVVSGNSAIVVNANDITLTLASNSGLAISSGLTIDSSVAGAGLTWTTGVLAVGAGNGITVNANDVALSTPGTLTVSSSNSASGNHTHAITSSSNPGAAASILASTSAGYLQLVRLGVGVSPSYPLHALATTEQLRLAYNSSNYTSFTVSSNGSLTIASEGAGGVTISQDVETTGTPTAFTVTGAAHTTLTELAEVVDVYFNLNRTVQFTGAAEAFTTQRALLITSPTYSASSATTIDTAATVAIQGQPTAGTNMTITQPLAFWVQIGDVYFQDSLFTTRISDGATSSATNVIYIKHSSTGTPAAGFGSIVTYTLETSTTDNITAADETISWATATHASRKGRRDFAVYDTASRTCLRLEASGSAAMIGFMGASAVVRQTVTGSRGGNAALASLLTALATFGLITDSSSA